MTGPTHLLHALFSSPLSAAIREGAWWFPIIETVHVVAITTVVGSITVVDLRLLGLAAHERSAIRVMRDLLPLTVGAFLLAVVSGSLMFMTNAVQYAGNPEFRWKLVLIAAAGLNMAVFHFLTQRDIERWDSASRPPTKARLAGAISLLLWIVIVFLGRWVGFVVAGAGTQVAP